MVQYIKKIAEINDADTYIEIFGGGGKCILNLDTLGFKFKTALYNELDRGLCSLFEVVQEPELCRLLYQTLKSQKCSKKLFDFCKENINNEDNNALEKAYMTYVLYNLSYNGEGKSYVAKNEDGYYRSLERLLEAHKHLENVRVSNKDGMDLLRKYGSNPKVVKYLDPPYHPATRAQGALDIYQNEMNIQQHKEMVDLLCQSRSWVMSSYDPAQFGNNDYLPLEKNGAKKVSIGKFNLYSGGCKHSKEEFIWYKV